ncbi:MAG: isoleucine--tRNA ligase [Defluviitaleaceae bacterium]|nr:isoleucine--tRNA ligase [Defluviitaleaceae bacterium]
MYNKVPTNLDFASREHDIQKFWQENDVFAQSIKSREGAPPFTFHDGPPTANGQPHIGHVVTRAIKDLFPRYKTMKGYQVLRKAGWDTHGLPVELEVEKALGISGKPEIEKYGMEPFIQQCKESVWKYEGLWKEMSERVGFWADMDNPYVTYHNNYIESVWWALSEIFKQDLIYKSYRVVPYCPRCGTPLSSHEVAQGYRDVVEDSAYVSFKVAGKDEYLMAWTTTPWTLPSNVGLCVNAKEEYAKVAQGGKVYILAKELIKEVMGEDDIEILETFKGQDLEGLKYEPLFHFSPTDESAYTVVCDSYVTLKSGTGIVHIAPAFGEDDARISKANGLPLFQFVDAQGNFTQEVVTWAGQFVKDADPLIIRELKISGKLFKKLKYEHSYPFCWRCKTPLLYYARDAWFIAVSRESHKLIANNQQINWMPEHMKDGRFGNFLEGIVDWSISRERYWGTPLPIWICEDENCAHRHCIGSIEELRQMSDNCPEDIELHRPYIDDVKLNCPKCSAKMTRTPEVIDCWFDSGSMPFAQWHYPFENKELFEKHFQADFISEGVDQTRGWFYSLLAISSLLFDKSPYKNVIVTGLGLDEHGKKMGKSEGNAVSPMSALDKHGADAVRWFMFVNSAPWLNFRYSDDTVMEGARRFMGTLWNTYAFYVLYAEIDQFNPYQHEAKDLSIMDQWLLSRLNSLIQNIDTALEKFEVTEPARMLDSFVDELSNWYLRRSRERYWGKEMTQNKINAYKTLHHALVTVAKLAAPFVPFITEQLYQNLVVNFDAAAPKSIHLCDFPIVEENENKEIVNMMATTMDFVALGRAARSSGNIKTRQPLGEMIVAMPGGGGETVFAEQYTEIIREELNVKAVRFISDASEYSGYLFKPQLRTLGPRYGKLVPKIGPALNQNPTQTMADLKAGEWKTTIDGIEIALAMDDVLVETTQKEGFATASDKGVTVVLDTTLTPELIEEGNRRELVSKWQSMRRDAGFDVTDRINAGYSHNAILSAVIENNANAIATELLADSLTQAEAPSGAFAKEWDINGEKIEMWVIKA